MRKSTYIFLSILFLSGCLGAKSISVDKNEVALRENIIEVNPNDYLEFVGLKNYSAQQIVDSLRASQPENTIIKQPLNACSAVMESRLDFEATSTIFVNKNYGIISVVENEEDYGIKKFPFPEDTLETNKEWDKEIVTLKNQENYNALRFLSQFLRSDGKKLTMKYKAVYKMIAEDYEKEFKGVFFDHINSLNTQDNYSKARETLKNDANQINRIWAFLILATTPPSDEDLKVQFKEILGPSDYNSSLVSTLMLMHIKLKNDIKWDLYVDEVKSIINGGALWRYDENIKLLVESGFPANLAENVFSDNSPVFRDRLNAYHSQAYEMPFKLIKMLSENKVKTRTEADKWLAEVYQN